MRNGFYKATSTRKPYRGKYVVVLAALCLLNIGCAGLRRCGPDDTWFGHDKAKHLFATAAISATATTIAAQDRDRDEAAAIGFGTAMAVGLGKEAYDLHVKETCWSWRDLAWDALGASLGATLAAQTTD
jgi:putative lipoprotein